MKFLRVGGVTIHYQIFGVSADAEKPALVFSNSLGTDFRIWREVVGRLVKDFAILLYDKRGHGLSDIGSTPYAMADHVGDLEALMDHVGMKNAVVCGLSVGGMIAQGLYAKRPDLVRALILCDTADKIGDADLWNPRIEKIEASGIEAISDMILERWFTADFRDPGNDAFPGYRNMLIRTTKAGYLGTCVALRDTDYRDQSGNIAVPTLLVVGAQDGSTPPDLVKATADRIPNSRFQIIDGCGHIPCVEKPAELTAVMQSFIADHGLTTVV